MAYPKSPKNANEAIAFLRRERDQGDLGWRRECLYLTRLARGLPGGWATATKAMYSIPSQYRVYNQADLRRGMVAFFDDPNDSNTAGHIVTVHGWRDGRLLVWSNDALRSGGVDLVPFEFFPQRWGDPFRWGATWLNGYLLTNTQSNLYARDR